MTGVSHAVGTFALRRAPCRGGTRRRDDAFAPGSAAAVVSRRRPRARTGSRGGAGQGTRGGMLGGRQRCDVRVLCLHAAHDRSELGPELLRDLPPAHTVGAHLQDALVLDGLAVVRDRSAIQRGLELLRRRVRDALLCELILRQRQRGRDVAVAHRLGRRGERRRWLAGLRERDLRAVAQAGHERGGVLLRAGEGLEVGWRSCRSRRPSPWWWRWRPSSGSRRSARRLRPPPRCARHPTARRRPGAQGHVDGIFMGYLLELRRGQRPLGLQNDLGRGGRVLDQTVGIGHHAHPCGLRSERLELRPRSRGWRPSP